MMMIINSPELGEEHLLIAAKLSDNKLEHQLELGPHNLVVHVDGLVLVDEHQEDGDKLQITV